MTDTRANLCPRCEGESYEPGDGQEDCRQCGGLGVIYPKARTADGNIAAHASHLTGAKAHTHSKGEV